MDKIIVLIVGKYYINNKLYICDKRILNCKYESILKEEEKCTTFLCKNNKNEKQCMVHKDKCIWDKETKICRNKGQDSDCSKIESLTGDDFNIHTVCPYSPECLGICLNDFTYTNHNLERSDSPPWKDLVGKLKIETKGENNQSHIFTSSRCFECVRNFYKITDLLSNNSCDYK